MHLLHLVRWLLSLLGLLSLHHLHLQELEMNPQPAFDLIIMQIFQNQQQNPDPDEGTVHEIDHETETETEPETAAVADEGRAAISHEHSTCIKRIDQDNRIDQDYSQHIKFISIR